MKTCRKLLRPLPYPSQAGQTLVIIVLVMAVSLTVGLAISTRSLKTMKETTYSAQSLAAYHAAEAGAEVALKRIADDAGSPGADCHLSRLTGDPSTTPCGASNVVLDGANYSYTVIKGGIAGDYSLTLERDKTQQIRLDTYGGSSIKVCWDLSSDPDPEAAVEMLFVYGSPPYSLNKYAVDGDFTRRRSNGFSVPGTGEGGYSRCHEILGLSSPQILRIKALYNGTSAVVKPAGVNLLPAQAYTIESTGTAGDTIRKLRVTKSLPALPEIFDFAIFTPAALTK